MRTRCAARVTVGAALSASIPATVTGTGVGHPCWVGRFGDSEAAGRDLLSGVAVGAAPAGRVGVGIGGGDQLPARGVNAADGEIGRAARNHPAVEVSGQRDGQGPRRSGGSIPHPAVGCRSVVVCGWIAVWLLSDIGGAWLGAVAGLPVAMLPSSIGTVILR